MGTGGHTATGTGGQTSTGTGGQTVTGTGGTAGNGSTGGQSGAAGSPVDSGAPDGGGSPDGGGLPDSGATSFSVAGTVTGLAGSGLTLQDGAGHQLAVSAAGAFVFADKLPADASVAVTVAHQPTSPTQTCQVTTASSPTWWPTSPTWRSSARPTRTPSAAPSAVSPAAAWSCRTTTVTTWP